MVRMAVQLPRLKNSRVPGRFPCERPAAQWPPDGAKRFREVLGVFRVAWAACGAVCRSGGHWTAGRSLPEVLSSQRRIDVLPESTRLNEQMIDEAKDFLYWLGMLGVQASNDTTAGEIIFTPGNRMTRDMVAEALRLRKYLAPLIGSDVQDRARCDVPLPNGDFMFPDFADPENNSQVKGKTRRPRPWDQLLNAIAKVTVADNRRSTWTHMAKVALDLYRCSPPYTPEEVFRLPEVLKRQSWWRIDMVVSAQIIQKHIGLVRAVRECPLPVSETIKSLDRLRHEAVISRRQKQFTKRDLPHV